MGPVDDSTISDRAAAVQLRRGLGQADQDQHVLRGGVRVSPQALEGDAGFGGTLLDQALIAWGTEIDNGQSHDHFDMPFVLAGGGAGRLNRGTVVDYPRAINFGGAQYTNPAGLRYHADLLLTIAKILNVPLSPSAPPQYDTAPLDRAHRRLEGRRRRRARRRWCPLRGSRGRSAASSRRRSRPSGRAGCPDAVGRLARSPARAGACMTALIAGASSKLNGLVPATQIRKRAAAPARAERAAALTISVRPRAGPAPRRRIELAR